MSRVAVVTGASGGIGRDVADRLVKAGYAVFDLSRSGSNRDGVRHIFCDVADQPSAGAAIEAVIAEAGQIDLLFNNAGMGISGAAEYASDADVRRLFDVNFMGALYVMQAAIPYMRQRRAGRIVSTCSVAGEVAIPFQAFYSASKAALIELSMALRAELKPFGIDVAVILPGDIKTGFTSARKKDEVGDDVYGGRIGRSVGRMERDEQSGMDSLVAAKKIVGFLTRRKLKPKYTVGLSYKLLVFLIKVLPASLVSAIIYQLYAK